MRLENLEQSKKYLLEANNLKNDIWRLWRYAKQNNNLILCGYNEPFDVTGFLIFQETTYIDVVQWLLQPTFELKDTIKDFTNIENKFPDNFKFEVVILTNDHKYKIECKKIILLICPKGAVI